MSVLGIVSFGIEGLETWGADSVRKLRLGVLAYVIKLLPKSLIVSDHLAVRTNGHEALERLDILQGPL